MRLVREATKATVRLVRFLRRYVKAPPRSRGDGAPCPLFVPIRKGAPPPWAGFLIREGAPPPWAGFLIREGASPPWAGFLIHEGAPPPWAGF